ncbi:CBS domain-containing protein [Granulicatella sp. zg-ZJ]|uniref:cyclic di-AMP binding protein CbpA n=1 Tax=Granulicatella sp. zg-ZJ TaxID=2678504 RepID=UPI0013CFC5C1|nr:cyclic di-AMP binding protein CbpA [Granulicatella sp. zg-ZJ]MBS4750847.1 CBS domain-containing protein [Carnobacteriaceae bacterium zg-ZUI78]NEW62254.1 CBS domain-containing protein [Granulicatella sp. zg-ZJ]
MIIQSIMIPKEAVHTVTTKDTIAIALDIMEDHNQRCIPILDPSSTLYRGNIYKYHIYRHLVQGGSLDEPVTTLLKNATKFVKNTDAFFKLFFTLGDLPYISVLNDKHHFLGIIRHTDMYELLSQSWKMTESSYALTISVPDNVTGLDKILKIIYKFTTITGLITLDREEFTLRKRIMVMFPPNFTKQQLQKLTDKLTAKSFDVLEVEDLTHGI